MQQYFSNVPLEVGTKYTFTKEQLHHVKDVMRMHDEVIRLVYQQKGYFARVLQEGKEVYAMVEQEDPRINELDCEITLVMALIRKEKFELILQKATELGVSKIVVVGLERSIVKAKSEKKDRMLERYRSIVLEASEQCKRNRIPEVIQIDHLKQIQNYLSNCNLVAYENEHTRPLSQYLKQPSYTVVVGPEGGFSKREIDELEKMGFLCVSLGNRILRAETAVFYTLSVLGQF